MELLGFCPEVMRPEPAADPSGPDGGRRESLGRFAEWRWHRQRLRLRKPSTDWGNCLPLANTFVQVSCLQ